MRMIMPAFTLEVLRSFKSSRRQTNAFPGAYVSYIHNISFVDLVPDVKKTPRSLSPIALRHNSPSLPHCNNPVLESQNQEYIESLERIHAECLHSSTLSKRCL